MEIKQKAVNESQLGHGNVVGGWCQCSSLSGQGLSRSKLCVCAKCQAARLTFLSLLVSFLQGEKAL